MFSFRDYFKAFVWPVAGCVKCRNIHQNTVMGPRHFIRLVISEAIINIITPMKWYHFISSTIKRNCHQKPLSITPSFTFRWWVHNVHVQSYLNNTILALGGMVINDASNITRSFDKIEFAQFCMAHLIWYNKVRYLPIFFFFFKYLGINVFSLVKYRIVLQLNVGQNETGQKKPNKKFYT